MDLLSPEVLEFEKEIRQAMDRLGISYVFLGKKIREISGMPFLSIEITINAMEEDYFISKHFQQAPWAFSHYAITDFESLQAKGPSQYSHVQDVAHYIFQRIEKIQSN